MSTDRQQSASPERGRPAPTDRPVRREARKPPPPPKAPAEVPGAEAALAYLARGWSVVPVAPKEKRPLVAWEPYQHRRPTEALVRSWYRRWPDAGVGIVTGLVSRLLVLDVDPAHGGEASLQRLSQAHGPLPWTVECHTGGGGRHLYFAHPGGVIQNRAGFRPGLDLRGDGGYVVAPPSVHPSGRPYAWSATGDPARAGIAELPLWLLQTLSGAAGRGRAGHPLSHWRKLAAEGVAEGRRNSTAASLTGHLLFHGVDAEVVRELLLCWNRVRCRPPLPDEEIARAVESIARTDARHREAEAAPSGGAGTEPDATDVDGG